MLDPRGFVDALIAVPIAFWNGCEAWLEAVHVVALVTAIAEKQRVLVVPRVTQLTEGLHDGLVPRNRSLQHIEAGSQLGRGLGLFHTLPPRHQTTGKSFLGLAAATRLGRAGCG